MLKIIIAGAGRIGRILSRQLSFYDHVLTLIDTDRLVLEKSMQKYDLIGVCGNCAVKDILLQAGVLDTDLLIAVTGSDEINLLCCATAHNLNPKLHTVARIRNPEYSTQIYDMQGIFALSMVINPELQTAVEIERLLKYPGFLKLDTFAKDRVEMVELKINQESPLCNVALSNISSVISSKILVCSVLRNGKVSMPSGDFILKEGDKIFVTAPSNNLMPLLDDLGVIRRKIKNVLICGGGRISYYLARLLAKNGIGVKIIENDYNTCDKLATLLPTATVVCGDAASTEFLESEGISQYDALVSLTDLDEVNMIISLYGNTLNIPKVITKIARAEDSRILDEIPLGSIVSPKAVSCDLIVRYVMALDNQNGAAQTMHLVADGQVAAMEFIVDETTKNCNVPLKDITLRSNLLVSCIIHSRQIEIPNGNSVFNVGDRVIIVSDSDNDINKLNDIFE